MKHRILSILCCLALIFALLPVSVLASDETTDTFGGKEFDLIRGYHYAPSNYGSSFDAYLPFFYSDGYFEEDSRINNQHLATMSLNLAIASNQDFSAADIFRHGPLRQLLVDIGCDEEKIFVNDADLKGGETDSIGFMIGQKELACHGGEKTGYTLLSIVPRSAGYNMEWISNFNIGPTGEAAGFAAAADEVMEGVEAYLERYGLADAAAEGTVKFWLVGHSRSAAVANLLSKRLVDAYRTDSVYCYTWETPIGGFGEENRHGNTDQDQYDCIHNFMNYADIVTMAAPEWMGLLRYGQDTFYPSADAGEYEVQKAAMLNQLAQIDPTYEFKDEFSLAYIPVSLDLTLSNIRDLLDLLDTREFLDTLSYTHTDSINHFAGDYMRLLVSQLRSWSLASREAFNQPVTLNKKTYISMQQALLRGLELYFSMDSYTQELAADKLMSIFADYEISDYWGIFTDVKDIAERWVEEYAPNKVVSILPYRTAKDVLSDSDKESYIKKYWNMIEASGALDVNGITAEQKADIEEMWPTVFCMLIPLLCADYNEAAQNYGYKGVSKTTVMTGTLLHNISLIPVNHIHSVTLAWARSFDNYYEDVPAYKESMDTLYSPVGAPTATVSLLPLSTSFQTPDTVRLSDIIKLDVPDRSGETITYTIKDSAGTVLVEDALYTDGVRLPESVCVGDTCSLSATVWSYGHTDSATFYFTAIPAVSAADITEDGISYRVDRGGAPTGSVQVIAAAYDGGRLVDSSVSALLTGSGTLTGTLPLDTDDGYAYRLFLIVGNTASPVCPCWSSDTVR